MPEKTLKAFADHGEVQGDKVSGTKAEAEEIFQMLHQLGIEFDDVVEVLEREGVQKFDASWAELVEDVKIILDEFKSGKGHHVPADDVE
jgi:transaldolase